MLGYDYEIIYKKGQENSVADALSCQFEEESTLLAISIPILEWIEEARREWFSHPGLSQLISQLTFKVSEDVCSHQKIIFLDRHEKGNPYFCNRMRCLPMPQRGDHKSTRHITTVAHPSINMDIGFYGFHYRSSKVRKQVSHHGGCGPTFEELFRLQGTQLKLSTSYHPQTDGQTEVVNKCLETYLRCVTLEKKHLWVQWLSLAKWWYNTNYHATTKMTPYEAVYVQLPPSPTSYIKGCSKVQAVDQLLQNRATMLAHLREDLHQAQNRMKQQVD
eukprot:PITA_33967